MYEPSSSEGETPGPFTRSSFQTLEVEEKEEDRDRCVCVCVCVYVCMYVYECVGGGGSMCWYEDMYM